MRVPDKKGSRSIRARVLPLIDPGILAIFVILPALADALKMKFFVASLGDLIAFSDLKGDLGRLHLSLSDSGLEVSQKAGRNTLASMTVADIDVEQIKFRWSEGLEKHSTAEFI